MPGGTTNADLIVQYWYKRKCDVAGIDDIPTDHKSFEQFAALHFAGKGVVIINAANLDGHDQSIDFMEILASVRFISGSPYLGFHFSLFSGPIPRSKDEEVPFLCFRCGASDKTEGVNLMQCSRCKVVTYCSHGCQKEDWKRHKKGECLPRDSVVN